jgi:tryptophan synthase alpha chain
MSRIPKIFSKSSEKLIPFITAGYPKLHSTVDLVLSAEKAGADMVEIGMPFSDPLADGPIIQASSLQAIKNGIHLDIIFEQIIEIRKSSNISIVLMGYINPIIHYGLLDFLDACRRVSVDGLIIPDLPPEEAEEWVKECKKRGISPILLIAPNTPNERIVTISKLAGDLVYCVAILGITGASKASEMELKKYLYRVKENCTAPFIVGFGISSSYDVKKINALSDGAVVGSALIEKIRHSQAPEKDVFSLVKNLKGKE